MSMDVRAESAIVMVDKQLQELVAIVAHAKNGHSFALAKERLRRWKTRTVTLLSDQIHHAEGEKLRRRVKTSFIAGAHIRNLVDEARMYSGFLLSLREELDKYPEHVLSGPPMRDVSPPPVEVTQPTGSRTVFLVHGHDETNTSRLEQLLRRRWHLEPIVLSLEPGKGRTLIEKFEQEAQRSAYAIVLFTPDDLVEVSDTKYFQARPNAIFELGWFYGRLGRQRVCILFKKGTKIPSDLDGITRIEFDDSVGEKIEEIENELREAGLI